MDTKSTRLTDHVPILALHRYGDGRRFSKALARIIVRRELISAGAIPDPDGCDVPSLAG